MVKFIGFVRGLSKRITNKIEYFIYEILNIDLDDYSIFQVVSVSSLVMGLLMMVVIKRM